MASQSLFCRRVLSLITIQLLLFSCLSCGSVIDREFFNNRLVKFHSNPENFFAAHENCQSQHMQLLTIQDDIETQLLINRLKELNLTTTWIGATDLGHQGVWMWTSNHKKVTSIPWGRSQPNNLDNNQRCMAVSNLFNGWNDEKCTAEISYFCEEIVVGADYNYNN